MMAYYSAKSGVDLVSLGFLQRVGCSYESDGCSHPLIESSDGCIINRTAIQSINLPAVYVSLLRTAYAPKLIPSRPSNSISLRCDCGSTAFVADGHLNVEQRSRCDRAEQLYQGVASHVSDGLLVDSLHNGAFA